MKRLTEQQLIILTQIQEKVREFNAEAERLYTQALSNASIEDNDYVFDYVFNQGNFPPSLLPS